MSEISHTDKNGVVYSFFNSFGIEAFPSTSVPTGSDAPEFPYITYDAPTDSDIEKVTVTADVWYRSTSWAGVNAMVETISQTVGNGYPVHCDNGGIIIRKEKPFAQPLADPEDNMIKRKHLLFEFTYVTTY